MGGREQFALAVEEFEGIPVLGIVRGGDDDAAIGMGSTHGKGCGGRGGEADVDHLAAHGHEGAHNDVAHHGARLSGIAPDDHLSGTQKQGEGRGIFHDVKRVKAFVGVSADGSADA